MFSNTTGFLTRFWKARRGPCLSIVPAAGDSVAVLSRPSGQIDGAVLDQGHPHLETRPDPVDDGVSLLGDTLNGIGAGRLAG